jgi:hypothetical protein
VIVTGVAGRRRPVGVFVAADRLAGPSKRAVCGLEEPAGPVVRLGRRPVQRFRRVAEVGAGGGLVKIGIKIGGAVVDLAVLAVDAAQAAIRAAESLVRQVVADVGKVVDWLTSLFGFKDIWQTKAALAGATETVWATVFGDRFER